MYILVKNIGKIHAQVLYKVPISQMKSVLKPPLVCANKLCGKAVIFFSQISNNSSEVVAWYHYSLLLGGLGPIQSFMSIHVRRSQNKYFMKDDI